MNNEKNIKTLLGMNQENMSMLLQITRSQWSMYVLGKRDLPVDAKLKLAEMLGFSQKETQTSKNFECKKMQDQKIMQFLESQELLNSKLQIMAKQKLKAIEKKYETALTAFQFIRFLENNVQKPTAAYQLLLQTIKWNAQIEIEKNDFTVQAQLRFKYEMLQAEEKILNKKIQRLR